MEISPTSEKHGMTVLALRAKAKRGRHENASSALVVMEHDQIVQNDEENALSSDDESGASNYDIVLDIPAKVQLICACVRGS